MCFRSICVVILLQVCMFVMISPVFLSSCKRNSSEEDIVLPVTLPLSRSVIGYGVANANYTRILDQQGSEGKSIGFLRKGQVVEILERLPIVANEKAEMWVRVSGVHIGWLKENELRIYPSESQAVTASEIISKQSGGGGGNW